MRSTCAANSELLPISLSIDVRNHRCDALPCRLWRDTIPTMLTRPIRIEVDDGWLVDFTEREDGSMNVLVTAPSGRSWTTDRSTMAEAIEVSVRIRLEQQEKEIQALDESWAGIATS